MTNKLKAIITIGVPGSGKSTWAKEYVYSNDKWVEINRDDIRSDLYFSGLGVDWSKYKFKRHQEEEVTRKVNEIINFSVLMSNNIIISDTNLNRKYRDIMIKKLEEKGYEVELKLFPISFEEAIKRDTARQYSVGYSTIARMYDAYEEQFGDKSSFGNQVNYGGELAYVFDVDGTLAHMKTRTPFEWDKVGEDTLDENVASTLKGLQAAGFKIVILSGRDSVCQAETIEWLNKHTIQYDALFMRSEGDSRKDTIIKKELYFNKVFPSYKVLGVFDDRPSVCRMWRDLGLTVFQVGNPYIEF